MRAALDACCLPSAVAETQLATFARNVGLQLPFVLARDLLREVPWLQLGRFHAWRLHFGAFWHLCFQFTCIHRFEKDRKYENHAIVLCPRVCSSAAYRVEQAASTSPKKEEKA